VGVARQEPPQGQPGANSGTSSPSQANAGLYRLEVTTIPGSGKLRTPVSLDRNLKESLQRAFSFLQANQDKMGLTPAIAQKDMTVEAVELTGGGVETTCGVAFFVAMMSALHDRPVLPGMVILGDLTIGGNIKGLASILELLQVAVDNGATRALVPIANKTQFTAIPEDVVERLELVFYGDADRALRRAIAT
jgi:ATP-dependent Lon protease